MSVALESLIRSNSGNFAPRESFLSLTRNNGQEIITVVGRTITITNLLGAQDGTCIKLDKEVPFEPLAMVMNKCEECLCLYNNREIAITFLKPIGSKITTNTFTKIPMAEDVIQVIFNNVSKFQTEIVILTKKSIQTVDINHSSLSPVLTYPLVSGSKFNSSFYSAEAATNIVDPVSICFQPSGDSKADLTLMLLTADSSLYTIYPFFPNELSVSPEWMTQFATYNSLLVQSTENPESYSKYTTGAKIASLLMQNQESCIISKILPERYLKGKISGPLAITPFPDELYGFDARKLVPLKDDIVCMILDGCIVALNYHSSDQMVFQGQSFESEDKFLLIDAQIVDSNKFGKLVDAVSHPVSKDSLFVTTSGAAGHKVLEADYSAWLSLLTADKEEEFIAAVKKGIPTTLLHLEDISIPCNKTEVGNSSKVALLGQLSEKQAEPTFTLAERSCNKLTFVWNSRSVYLVTLNTKAGINVSIISALDNANEDDKSNEPLEGDEDVRASTTYKSKLSADVLVPEIKSAKSTLSELVSSLNAVKPRILNIDKANVEDLQAVLEVADLTTKGQLVLFKTLSILSERLRQMSLEYHQQIHTIHTLRMKKKEALETCKENKQRFESLLEKQKDLKDKYGKLNGSVNNLYNNIRCEYLSISKEERVYFSELQKIDLLVKEKTKQEDEIRQLLRKVDNAELSSIAKISANITEDPQSVLKLGLYKKNLQDKGQFINYLTSFVENITV